jgi:hypothetical protein
LKSTKSVSVSKKEEEDEKRDDGDLGQFLDIDIDLSAKVNSTKKVNEVNIEKKPAPDV